MILDLLKEGLFITNTAVSVILDLFSAKRPPGELRPDKINIVLVYGFLSTQTTMLPLQKGLRRNEYNILLPDLSLTVYDIDWHARELVCFFEEQKKILKKKYNLALSDIRDKILFFGHSMGGLIILAAQRIDRELLDIPIVTAGTPLKGAEVAVLASLVFFWSTAIYQMYPNSAWLKNLSLDLEEYPRKMFSISALIDELVPLNSSHLNNQHPWMTTKIIGHIALIYELVLTDILKRKPV